MRYCISMNAKKGQYSQRIYRLHFQTVHLIFKLNLIFGLMAHIHYATQVPMPLGVLSSFSFTCHKYKQSGLNIQTNFLQKLETVRNLEQSCCAIKFIQMNNWNSFAEINTINCNRNLNFRSFCYHQITFPYILSCV